MFFYDEASSFVGMLISVIRDRQGELAKYIRATYSNVTVFMHDNWMRLDFNKDGSVTSEDLRKNLTEFYRFLINFHYLEETIRISSSLYDEAKKLIKKGDFPKEKSDHKDEPSQVEPVLEKKSEVAKKASEDQQIEHEKQE